MHFWDRLTEKFRNRTIRKRDLSFDSRAVTQIDVLRQPTLVVENFWIILFSESGVLLAVVDHEPGYEDFRCEVLKAWPEIEKPLSSVFCGPPDIEERATLWKSRKSY